MNAELPLDLLITVLLGVLAVASAFLLPDGNVLRVILTVPLMMFYPGYALVSALWPRSNADGKSIDAVDRVALSIGLSITIMAIIGLLASVSHNMNVTTILTGNLLAVIVFALIAILRRSKLSREARFIFKLHGEFFPTGTEKALAALVVSGIVICSGFMAYSVFKSHAEEGHSIFYVLNGNSTAILYPLNVSINETGCVILGLINHEDRTVNYTVQAHVGNATAPIYLDDWDATQHLSNDTALSRNVTLSDNDMFEDEFRFYFTEPGEYKITWQLFMEAVPTNYNVHLWIIISP